MSVSSGTMPIERSYLRRAWLIFLLLAAAIVIAIAITAPPVERIGDLRAPSPQVQQAPLPPGSPLPAGNGPCNLCR